MCGRYDNLLPRDVYPNLYRVMRTPDWNYPPRYNTAPTDPVPIVRVDPRDGVRELAIARWGLVPPSSTELPKIPHINARDDKIAKLGLFKSAFARRRALVPATGFYEWEKAGAERLPWRFTLADEKPFAFAGLWEFARIDDRDVVSMAIITTRPNPLVARVHDRMPVILSPADYGRWLDELTPAVELHALLRPYDANGMRGYRVATAVNSVKNDVPECIEPLEEARGSLL